MTAVALPAIRRLVPTVPKRWLALGLAGLAAVLFVLFAGSAPVEHRDDAPFFLTLNDVRDWVRDNRDNPVLLVLFTVPRVFIDALVSTLITVLHAVGWPALVALAGTLGLLAGGWTPAGIAVTGFLSLGVLGLWEHSVDTLAAILAAVAISLAIGVPLGILAAGNQRFRRVISPVLDTMQIMPTFAYLGPMVLLFGIGHAAATIATLIYAMPAAIRITELGIRQVPQASVEAGESLGATRWQLLGKVRLPQAGRALGLAVNQTIMLALSMVVITALIDAPGLGQDIIRALIRNNVGTMFDAGVAIVILAIVLDRLTERLSLRLDPRYRAASGERSVPRRIVRIALIATVAAIVVGVLVPALREFPDEVGVSFREPVNGLVDWLRTNASFATGGLKDAVSFAVLNPLQTVFTEAPWWLVIGVVFGIAGLVSGIRPAVIAAACLGLVFAIGLWRHATETLLQVLVATAVAITIGLVFGILSARSDRFSALLRPVLDAAQTMPSFVYLLPAFILFDPSRFTAIFAAVIFAVPPVIRLVDVGIRLVPPAMIEAATSAGATSWQLLTKVQLPAARGAILLATNQAVILVLSMVVVGGLVGGGALGYDVVAGFSQGRLFGMGVAAGIALVLLGIMLDRITQGAGGRRVVGARG
ncbi:MAG TPA: ABC transporter permease subunit [Candidatus Limnocylindrales bacterium]|nr:ABC transporter permease subunit [Candidatus Limnocylindrales bacterium]